MWTLHVSEHCQFFKWNEKRKKAFVPVGFKTETPTFLVQYSSYSSKFQSCYCSGAAYLRGNVSSSHPAALIRVMSWRSSLTLSHYFLVREIEPIYYKTGLWKSSLGPRLSLCYENVALALSSGTFPSDLLRWGKMWQRREDVSTKTRSANFFW